MSIFNQIIPSLQILKILGNTNSFEQWLKKAHPGISSSGLFEGLKENYFPYGFKALCKSYNESKNV